MPREGGPKRGAGVVTSGMLEIMQHIWCVGFTTFLLTIMTVIACRLENV
jgi:hypothetical protein